MSKRCRRRRSHPRCRATSWSELPRDALNRLLLAGTACSPNSPIAVLANRAIRTEGQLPGTVANWCSRPSAVQADVDCCARGANGFTTSLGGRQAIGLPFQRQLARTGSCHARARRASPCRHDRPRRRERRRRDQRQRESGRAAHSQWMRRKQSRRSPKITRFVGILLHTVAPCKTCFLLRLPKKEAVTREKMALAPFKKAKAVFEFSSPARSPGFSALSEQIERGILELHRCCATTWQATWRR